MISLNILITIVVLIPLVDLQTSNETNFVATREWQEIKPGKKWFSTNFPEITRKHFLGQKVPQGLHYRINLQTGFKEAKILEEEKEKTSLLQIDKEQDDETTAKDLNTDVEMESARLRLEDALKNIPQEKFDDLTEERWKEIASKYKSYKELKQDLKDLELNMQTEAEIMKDLFAKFSGKDESSIADKSTILEDLEYLCHSIDNSLLFISMGGVEKIILPTLNQSSIDLKVKSLKTLGVVLQNNQEAKNYVIEKTSISNHLINILSKSVNGNQLSASIFAYGSLMRNNRKVSTELARKGMTVLIEIIASDKSEISLPMKTKALVLVADLINSDELKDQEYDKILVSLKVCEHLSTYLSLNRNGFIVDIDSSEKAINSLASLKQKCLATWSQSPKFRHELLVLINHTKSQLEASDEDLSFVYSENLSLLEELNNFLYGDLSISDDDLSKRYEGKVNDEF